jgi:transketolase
MLESLRAVPNMLVIRPCDGNEVVGAYIIAMESTHTPTVISLSRQPTPSMAQYGSSTEKVLRPCSTPAGSTLTLTIPYRIVTCESVSSSSIRLTLYSFNKQVALGAYTLQDMGSENSVAEGGSLPHPTIILLATGTEVPLAVGAAQILVAESAAASSEGSNRIWVRVVSMPSCELFDRQPLDYQRSVLMNGAPIMSIEASGVVGGINFLLE